MGSAEMHCVLYVIRYLGDSRDLLSTYLRYDLFRRDCVKGPREKILERAISVLNGNASGVGGQ